MFTPIKDKIVIKRDPAIEEIKGLYVPEMARQKEIFGTVVAVGPTAKEVTSGQRVCFGKIDGVSLNDSYFDEPGDYIILSENQIRGIVNATQQN